jgi:hypothetical protein
MAGIRFLDDASGGPEARRPRSLLRKEAKDLGPGPRAGGALAACALGRW